ncbi:hypothetical protein Salat_2850000 [Sesamum alatum]|uniref:Uncharacterized protein n=1 Tax=Sesamum alatum TaxID=300844 RepID=A0AAE1XLU9_9LAMI|nr:hypothetical protein Salat_2850000 [Sesamum alatum]
MNRRNPHHSSELTAISQEISIKKQENSSSTAETKPTKKTMMDPYHYSCIKFFTFFLPLFCLLSWSWGASSTAVPSLPPPSSALLAAETIRTRGYSLFASVIDSISVTAPNFSGTLLAPPDFAFSFATAKFLNSRRPPPRPSIPLLLYHTLKPPLVLTWSNLSSRDDGDELRTLYNNNCLYLFTSSLGGEVSISSSPIKNPPAAVKIRQPDLYVDDHLTVHGIDGALDLSSAAKCSTPDVDPAAEAVPQQADRTLLDHAVKALKRRGYNVVAAAIAIRKSELLSLTSVTVFAVSDENLFLKPDGFRYDFHHHVVPVRHRLANLAKSTADVKELDTLAPNKTVIVHSIDGVVSVDGIPVNAKEVYHNRWIVVISLMTSLDDVVDFQWNPSIAGATFPVSTPTPFSGVPPPAPAYDRGTENGATSVSPANFIPQCTTSPGTPSSVDGGISDDAPSFVNTSSSPPPAAAEMEAPSPSPEADDVRVTHCDPKDVVSIGVEGADLFCPVRTVRQLREMSEDLTLSDKVKIVENVNIADDLFFYT